MIKKIFMSCMLSLSVYALYSQVGIGTTSPDESSVLDVSSNDKGFLFPRMTTIQRSAIVNPAKGLTIYNLDEDCLQINLGSTSSPDWSCVEGAVSAVVNDCDVNGFEGAYANAVALTASNKFSLTITNNSFSNASINFAVGDLVLSGVSGISVNSVSPTSATIASGGSLVVEYELIGTPASTGTLEGVWTKLSLNCTKTVNVINGDATFNLPQSISVNSVMDGTPLADIQGVVDNGTNQITIKLPYTGGAGVYAAYTGTYVANNSGTAEGGDANSFRLTYPGGTFSSSGTITVTIEVDGDGSFNAEKQLFGIQETIASLDFQVNGNSKGNINLDVSGGILDRNFQDSDYKFVYLPVTAADGNVWLSHNLGANYSNMSHAQFSPAQQATTLDDHHAYGSFFQWGRYSDGHELINWTSSTVGTPVTTTTSSSHSTTITPNNSIFYLGDDAPTTQDNNWLDFGVSPNETEDSLWQGELGINNPCPQGYRLPTEVEMNALILAESITNYTTAANSSLAFSAGGYRHNVDGSMTTVGSNGYYWTSTVSGAFSEFRFFNNGTTGDFSFNRAYGFPVRCIKD